jgi:AraC-like DNA-binding protein
MTRIGGSESATTVNSAAIHFSTQQLAPAARLPALRDLFDRSVQLEIDAEPGQAVEMTMALVPGVRRARMLSSLTARMNRPTPMLADGEDTVCLMVKTGGHLAVRQGRREGVPQVGDGVLLVYREPASLQFVKASYLSVRVPFSALALANNVSAAAARCIPRDTEALSLLRAYVASMPDKVADPQLVRLYATHVYDLISLAIGATEEGRHLASQRGVRAARREAIRADLIRDPRVSLDQLAAQQGVSPRYVQMLFEEDGTTFSEFALERRLDMARAMLTSPRYGTWSVTAIALEAGFGDISYFNRRFKRRFLMTPTDVRAQSGCGRMPAPASEPSLK